MGMSVWLCQRLVNPHADIRHVNSNRYPKTVYRLNYSLRNIVIRIPPIAPVTGVVLAHGENVHTAVVDDLERVLHRPCSTRSLPRHPARLHPKPRPRSRLRDTNHLPTDGKRLLMTFDLR